MANEVVIASLNRINELIEEAHDECHKIDQTSVDTELRSFIFYTQQKLNYFLNNLPTHLARFEKNDILDKEREETEIPASETVIQDTVFTPVFTIDPAWFVTDVYTRRTTV